MTSHLANGRTGLVRGEDALCEWVEIVQDDTDHDVFKQTYAQALAQDYDDQHHPNLLSNFLNPILRRQKRQDKQTCPPKKGKAEISYTILLLGGWQPEANYTVEVRATEESKKGGTIFDLGADFELKEKEGWMVE